MRFELIGKTPTTLTDVDIQSLKMGQTDLKPAIALVFKVRLPNTALDMLDKSLLPFLYKKVGADGAKQKQLEGIEVVSEMPELTQAGIKIGPIDWDAEQTGCTLNIYHGIRTTPAWILRDGTVSKLKVVRHEGGTVDFAFRFYTADVDAEVMGELGVLKSHDIDVELTAPEPISAKQKQLTDEEPSLGADGALTPEKALAKALQQNHEGKEVTVVPPARKTPLAKKIARGSAAAKKTTGARGKSKA